MRGESAPGDEGGGEEAEEEEVAEEVLEEEIIKIVENPAPEETAVEPSFEEPATEIPEEDEPIVEKIEKEDEVQGEMVEILPPTELMGEQTIEAPKKEEEMAETETGCPDLIMEQLRIHKQTRNSVILAYTLRNVGIGKINIKGFKGQEALALRGHLSSSRMLSRGALTIGGKFVNAGDHEAWLMPGATYEGEIKLPLHKLTKFTPYLIIQIDPYQMAVECDETNNLQFINLLPDSPISQKEDQ